MMVAVSASIARRALFGGVVGTTSSVLPAFMTGAIAVQLADDLALGASQLGLVIGGFFASAALGSVLLGRLAERLGPGPAMRIGLLTSLVTGLALSQARSALHLGLALLVAGTSNALTQPAANLLLVRHVPAGRLGLAMALKQAGMPIASLLGGVAVPVLALTVGWRWAYVAAALVAAAALAAVPSLPHSARNRQLRAELPGSGRLPGSSGSWGSRAPSGSPARPDLPRRLLIGYAVVGLLGAAAAGATVSFLVSAGEGSGLSPGAAGLLLTGGSAVGITSRILHGRWADGPRLLPIRRVALLLGVGGLATLVLALDTPAAYVGAVVPVFAFGWAWPGLFNLSVVRNNPSAAAASTGVTQTGVYIGAGAGPVLGGLVVDAAGYPALWWAAGLSLLLASGTALLLRARLRARRTSLPPDGCASDVSVEPSSRSRFHPLERR